MPVLRSMGAQDNVIAGRYALAFTMTREDAVPD